MKRQEPTESVEVNLEQTDKNDFSTMATHEIGGLQTIDLNEATNLERSGSPKSMEIQKEFTKDRVPTYAEAIKATGTSTLGGVATIHVIAKEGSERAGLFGAGMGSEPTGEMKSTQTEPVKASRAHSRIGYFKTIPGVIKLIQLTIGIICISLIATLPLYGNRPGTEFFLSVCSLAMVSTLVWTLLCAFKIDKKMKMKYCSWNTLELLCTGGICFLYALASAVQFTIYSYPQYSHPFYTSYYDQWMGRYQSDAAAGFGVINFLAYAAGSVVAFKQWRATQLAVKCMSDQSPPP